MVYDYQVHNGLSIHLPFYYYQLQWLNS